MTHSIAGVKVSRLSRRLCTETAPANTFNTRNMQNMELHRGASQSKLEVYKVYTGLLSVNFLAVFLIKSVNFFQFLLTHV